MVQHFWRLQSPASQRKRAEWDDEAVELESVKCPINPMHQHPPKMPLCRSHRPEGYLSWTFRLSRCIQGQHW